MSYQGEAQITVEIGQVFDRERCEIRPLVITQRLQQRRIDLSPFTIPLHSSQQSTARPEESIHYLKSLLRPQSEELTGSYDSASVSARIHRDERSEIEQQSVDESDVANQEDGKHPWEEKQCTDEQSSPSAPGRRFPDPNPMKPLSDEAVHVPQLEEREERGEQRGTEPDRPLRCWSPNCSRSHRYPLPSPSTTPGRFPPPKNENPEVISGVARRIGSSDADLADVAPRRPYVEDPDETELEDGIEEQEDTDAERAGRQLAALHRTFDQLRRAAAKAQILANVNLLLRAAEVVEQQDLRRIYSGDEMVQVEQMGLPATRKRRHPDRLRGV